MRSFIIRILQAVVIVAVASSLAHADNFMYFKKKAAAGGGGGEGPPAGTLLAGDNTDYGNIVGNPAAGNCIYDSEGYVAAATAQVTTGYVRYSSGTDLFKVLIYDSGKNLIGTSDAGTMAAGWRSVTFTGGPTITSGQTYYLAVVRAATGGYIYTGLGTGRIINDTSGTYATPPDPIAGSNWNEITYEIGIYVTN